MTNAQISIIDGDGMRRVEINRPEKVNALNAAMMTSIADAVRGASAAGAEMLVIAGNGEKGLCAGADIEEFARGEDRLRAQEHALLDLIDALDGLPLPIVVLAHGRTLGAGGILVSLADLTLAADDLRFGFPEIRFNMYPVIVHAVLMRKIHGPMALQLCTTGRLLDGVEAQAMGLVSEVMPASTFARESVKRLRFYLERRAALAMAKRAMRVTAPRESLQQRLAVLAPMMVENYLRPGVSETIAEYLAGIGGDNRRDRK